MFLTQKCQESELEVGEVAGVGGEGKKDVSKLPESGWGCNSGALALPATPSPGNESLEGGVVEVSRSAHRSSGSSPKEG